MSKIDWSKAGTRIRWQEKVDGRNPDWDWIGNRWKDEADYYGEELSKAAVVEMTHCPRCEAPEREACRSVVGRPIVPHRERVYRAGQLVLKERGPRFTRSAQA